jgi:hypothetical protein
MWKYKPLANQSWDALLMNYLFFNIHVQFLLNSCILSKTTMWLDFIFWIEVG